MSLFAMLSFSAGATTWHNRGGTNFSATGGAVKLSVTGTQWRWTSTDVTGTVSPALTYSIPMTSDLTGFQISGIPYNSHCSYTFTMFNAAQTMSSVAR